MQLSTQPDDTSEERKKHNYFAIFTCSSKKGTVICLQFSKTAKGILFRHLRHFKNIFLRQRTRIVDFAAKGECSGKSET